jgi:hypothetical protein
MCAWVNVDARLDNLWMLFDSGRQVMSWGFERDLFYTTVRLHTVLRGFGLPEEQRVSL